MAEGRKVLWILGAGAPRGAGAYTSVQGGGRIPIPIQQDFWPVVLRFCQPHSDRRQLESFLFRYFTHYSKVPARTRASARVKLLTNINVEEVFTFISERVHSPSTSPQLRKYFQGIWTILTRQIGRTFRRFSSNAKTRQFYRQLTNRLIKGRDAVISFNYDTVFEDSIPHSRWHYFALDDGDRGWPILKPHGSVNWARAGEDVQIAPDPIHPVVVAPTHLKFVGGNETIAGYLNQSPTIQRVWTEMERQMTLARVLVFIGYSFPPADLYFSSVFRTVLADRSASPRVVLVNPDAQAIARHLSDRFALSDVGKHFDLGSLLQTSREAILNSVT